jgi:hypothetical protein
MPPISLNNSATMVRNGSLSSTNQTRTAGAKLSTGMAATGMVAGDGRFGVAFASIAPDCQLEQCQSPALLNIRSNLEISKVFKLHPAETWRRSGGFWPDCKKVH